MPFAVYVILSSQPTQCGEEKQMQNLETERKPKVFFSRSRSHRLFLRRAVRFRLTEPKYDGEMTQNCQTDPEVVRGYCERGSLAIATSNYNQNLFLQIFTLKKETGGDKAPPCIIGRIACCGLCYLTEYFYLYMGPKF